MGDSGDAFEKLKQRSIDYASKMRSEMAEKDASIERLKQRTKQYAEQMKSTVQDLQAQLDAAKSQQLAAAAANLSASDGTAGDGAASAEVAQVRAQCEGRIAN